MSDQREQLEQLIEQGGPRLIEDIISAHEQPTISWILLVRGQGGIPFWIDDVHSDGAKEGFLLEWLPLEAEENSAEIALVALCSEIERHRMVVSFVAVGKGGQPAIVRSRELQRDSDRGKWTAGEEVASPQYLLDLSPRLSLDREPDTEQAEAVTHWLWLASRWTTSRTQGRSSRRSATAPSADQVKGRRSAPGRGCRPR